MNIELECYVIVNSCSKMNQKCKLLKVMFLIILLNCFEKKKTTII